MRVMLAQPNLGTHAAVVRIGGKPVRFSVEEVEDVRFDATAPQNREKVLVRVRAFSLNYRDRAVILQAFARNRPEAVGSEFVGVVVSVGRDVRRFRLGQRVVGEMAWPTNGVPGTMGGVPTNAASAELRVFHQGKLVAVPVKMPDEVAASFVLGSQTAHSMIRRLELKRKETVLVTAGGSNTALFAINVLRRHPIDLYVTTTSRPAATHLRRLGVKKVFVVAAGFDRVEAEARRIGGFDAVIDPFSDVYLPKVIRVMRFFGRYVTCGLAAQDRSHTETRLCDVLAALIVKNIRVTGNCLGVREDLERALRDWSRGRFQVTVDSVFSGSRVGPFIERTYNSPTRFGKVVYRYS